MDLGGLFSVLMRFLHIGSVAGLVGGAVYARAAALPALETLPETAHAAATQTAQTKFRGLLFAFLLLVVISGLYNGFGPGAPHHTTQWQIWFGIKMLFVLHFLSTGVLWVTAPYDAGQPGKTKRRLQNLVVSGFIIILIGDYLRYLTLHTL